MRAVLLAVLVALPAAALAGCIQVRVNDAADSCGSPDLRASADVARPGEVVSLSLWLNGCEGVDDAGAAACAAAVPPISVSTGAPGEFPGTLRCVPRPLNASLAIGAVPARFEWIAHGPPAIYRFEASGRGWQAQDVVRVESADASPVCGKLSVAASREWIRPGEDVTIDVLFANCGAVNATLPGSPGMCGPRMRPYVVRGSASWYLAEGAANGTIVCLDTTLSPTPVPPGGEHAERSSWNGTVQCGWGCWRDAEPGDWVVKVSVTVLENATFEAATVVRVVGRDDPAPTGHVDARTLAHGTSSGIDSALREVVTSRERWVALWTEHQSNRACSAPQDRSCLPAAPEVDFGRERVVALWVGTRPNTCHGVEITSVREEPARIVVEYAERGPLPGMGCGQALTQPHHAVAIPAGDKPVEFVAAT